jgi:hypothetical protein
MQVRCLSIVAAMVLAAVSAMAQGAGMVLYEHPTLGFSLLLPAGWTMAPASSDYDVQVQDANCLVQVASTTMSSVVDPHLFVAEWERHIVGPDKTYSRRLSQTDRAVAGARAVQGVYDSTIFGAPATGNITVVSLPGRVYVISVICLRQAYDERRPLIESVLTSFQAPVPAAPATAPSKPAAPVAAPPKASDGYVGMDLYSPADKDAQRVGLTAGQTVVVAMVRPSSAAAAAGILPGDIIVGMAGRPVRAVADVMATPTPQGQPVEITLVRRGETRKVKVVPGARPAGLQTRTFTLDVQAGAITELPSNWTWVQRPGLEGSAMLSRATPAGKPAARIEIDRLPPGWSNVQAIVEATAAAKQKIAKAHPGATFIDGPPYPPRAGTSEVPGAQFEAEYNEAGKPVRHWTVVLSDGYGGAIMWAYVAGDDAFDGTLAEARQMLGSLIIFPRPVAAGR